MVARRALRQGACRADKGTLGIARQLGRWVRAPKLPPGPPTQPSHTHTHARTGARAHPRTSTHHYGGLPAHGAPAGRRLPQVQGVARGGDQPPRVPVPPRQALDLHSNPEAPGVVVGRAWHTRRRGAWYTMCRVGQSRTRQAQATVFPIKPPHLPHRYRTNTAANADLANPNHVSGGIAPGVVGRGARMMGAAALFHARPPPARALRWRTRQQRARPRVRRPALLTLQPACLRAAGLHSSPQVAARLPPRATPRPPHAATSGLPMPPPTVGQ